MVMQVLKRLFTSTEYHQMIEAGILAEDDRLELIADEVITMSPISSRHAACVKRLNQLFSRRVGQRALVGIQDPIHLDEHSEPQPDLALLQTRTDFYIQAHPEPEDIFLVIEVAETSADYDWQIKVPLYAKAGIVEVWLINLAAEVIEVYRQPTSTGYQDIQQMRRGQRLSVQLLPDLELMVAEIFD